MKKILLHLLFLILFSPLPGQEYRLLREPVKLTGGVRKPVTLMVIYDNYSFEKELIPNWGYSVLIEGLDKKILFDTGADPEILRTNIRKLGLDLSKVDILVLSHEHADHTGGIPAFGEMNNNIPAICPHSFSGEFTKRIAKSGFTPLLVSEPAQICSNLYTSGEFGGEIPEQALVLDTGSGLVVMTGCSHPGIIEMLKKIKADFGKDIYMVLGGFHLLQKPDAEMNKMIEEMKRLGIVKCGATHCTGERQTQMIREAFNENFVILGAGASITLN